MFLEESYNEKAIEELIDTYERLKNGERNVLLEKEDFEDLCDYYESNGNSRKAEEVISFGIKIYSFSSELKLKKANLMISSDKDEEADSLLSEAFLLDGMDIDYCILKTELLIRKKLVTEAHSFITGCLNNFGIEDKVAILSEIVSVFLDYAELNSVLTFSFQLLSLQNDNSKILSSLAYYANSLDKNQESIEFHQKLVSQNPYNHLVWFNIGYGFESLGLLEKAIEAYEYSYYIKENDVSTLYQLSKCFIVIKNFEKAITYLLQIITIQEKINPNQEPYSLIAKCYEKTKKIDLAILNYKNALKHDHKFNSLIIYNLCRVLMKGNRFGEALSVLKSTKDVGKNLNLLFLLGLVYLKMNQYSNAYKAFYNCLIIKRDKKKYWLYYIKSILLYVKHNKIEDVSEFNGDKIADLAYRLTNKSVFVFYKIVFLLLNDLENEAKELFEKHITGNEKIFLSVSKKFAFFKKYEWCSCFLKK